MQTRNVGEARLRSKTTPALNSECVVSPKSPTLFAE